MAQILVHSTRVTSKHLERRRTSREEIGLGQEGHQIGRAEIVPMYPLKNLMVRFGYNEYMAHHYAYMTKVAEVRELESYAEAAKDGNWYSTMEEEMQL